MVLAIIFSILLVLLLLLLIFFLFYILLPSIKSDVSEDVNPVYSSIEKNFISTKEIPVEMSDKRAVVLCNPEKSFQNRTLIFNRKHSCSYIYNSKKSSSDCAFACIGLGDCAKACPQYAIFIKDGTAVVSNACIGCGKCVSVCPKNMIKLVSPDTKEIELCSYKENVCITTCSKKGSSEKIERIAKKHFKIWDFCYRIIKGKTK